MQSQTSVVVCHGLGLFCFLFTFSSMVHIFDYILRLAAHSRVG